MFSGKLLSCYEHNLCAISDSGSTVTYKEVASLGTSLYANIGHRCLVFCLCSNTIESLVGYTSFITNKVVPLMLDGALASTLLNDLIRIYQPEFIWLPSERSVEFPTYQVIHILNGYSLLRVSEQRTCQLHDELALLLTTSGSTGSPKLVRLSYRNIQANATSIIQYLSITDDERPVTTLPMNYSFGLSIINSHLTKGATILLTNKSLMEKEFWSFLKNQKATSLSGVPYTFEILKKLRFFRMDLPSLKTLTQAGGKLNQELNKEFADYCLSVNKRFFVMYGQTEATARMSYLPYNEAVTKTGSIGIAIPGGEFHLENEKSELITDCDTVGELVYKGPNVSMGYAECVDDLVRDDENKGLLRTGDLAKKDADNYYYIVGRKKRFIKLFGNRVNLDETERLLKNLTHNCACTGSDDKMIIYITEKNMAEKVQNYISEMTGINRNAFSVKVIDEIPKNTSGKTIYSKLDS